MRLAISRLLCLAPPALLACASAPPPASAPAPVVDLAVKPPPAPPAAPTVDVAPEPSPPALEAPGAQACLYSTNDALTLRFRPGAPPFATLQGAGATLDFTTAGPSAGAFARATLDGFTVQGVVDGADLVLFPARASVLAGFLIPQPSSHLEWSAAAPGSLTVTFTPDEELEVLPEAQLGPTSLPCDAVSLDAPGFEARDAGPKGAKEREATLPFDKAIPIARTPGGPAIARLRLPRDADNGITVVETRGRHMLIVREGVRQVVFGWVAASDVKPASTGDVYGYGGLGMSGIGDEGLSGVRTRFRCGQPIALVAEVAGERRVVGSIAADTPIYTFDEHARGVVPVLLPSKLAATDSAAKLGVLSSELANCGRER